MKPQPIPFIWDGRCMVPLQRHKAMCDRQFKIGQEYAMIPHEERSAASQNHYHAAIKTAFDSLPEEIAPRFPSIDHFRKWCLIKCGFADNHTVVNETIDDAQKMAVLARALDGYAVITVSGPVVTVWTAQSQSAHAMGKEAFQDSKQRVLDMMADMIGVAPGKLAANAGRAA